MKKLERLKEACWKQKQEKRWETMEVEETTI
jgi:hypothetical protein